MRILGILLVIALVLVAAHDFVSEPRYSYSARAAVAAIDGYRANISPHLTGKVQCRFTPTCSAYGREAIRKYGFAVGGWRALRRVARCNAWTPMGTVDQP